MRLTTCPTCGREYRIRPDFAGSTIRCRECGETIRLRRRPNPNARTGRPPQRRRKPGKRRKSTGTPAWVWWTVGAGAVVVVLAIGGIWLALSRGERPQEVAQQADASAGSSAPADAGASETPEGQAATAQPAEPKSQPAGAAPADSPNVAANGGSSSTPAAASTAASTAAPAGTAAIAPGKPPTAPEGFPLEPDPLEVEWKASPTLAPSYARSTMIFPASPVPLVLFRRPGTGLVQAECWNLATGERVRTVPGLPNADDKSSLSPTGKRIAVHDPLKPTQVEVWSLESGQRVASFEVARLPANVEQIALVRDDRLLVVVTEYAVPMKKRARLFDVATGREIASRALGSRWSGGHAAVSPAGRYVALLLHDESMPARPVPWVELFTTEALQRVARVPLPLDAYANVHGLAFSRAGDRLMLVATGLESTQLIEVRLTDGKPIDHRFAGNWSFSPLRREAYVGPAIEPLADDAGWLVFGRTIVDAAVAHRVWYVDTHRKNLYRRLIIKDGVLIKVGGFDLDTGELRPSRFEPVSIPFERIQQSLHALQADVPARLRPGTEIGIRVQVGTLRGGTAEHVGAELATALKTALLELGLRPVAEKRPITLHLHYSEQQGREMSFQPLLSRPGSGGNTTVVRSTAALLKFELRTDDGTAPLWRFDAVIDPSGLVIRNDPTEANLRDKVFEEVLQMMPAFPLPYFIPADDRLVTLPGTTIVGDAPPPPAPKKPGRPVAEAPAPSGPSKVASLSGRDHAQFVR
ncbi:MAG: hypothetical protein D6725_11095 [Planctomycetota bacterium]|nr:MAG: hypothetical protein D6725_11095 [Planctomycetota bacterium]